MTLESLLPLGRVLRGLCSLSQVTLGLPAHSVLCRVPALALLLMGLCALGSATLPLSHGGAVMGGSEPGLGCLSAWFPRRGFSIPAGALLPPASHTVHQSVTR